MHVVAQHQDRILLSIGTGDLHVLIAALAGQSSTEAQRLLSQLQSELVRARQASELVEAWADHGSVQVRAITVHGDPLDLSEVEARAFAARILTAADEAE